MAADLSFLFRDTPPAGAMAGVQQGIGNAKTLMDLDKSRVDTATSQFNLDRSRQMLPFELQNAQSDSSIKAHNASPDMLALDKRQKTANAGVTEAQYKEAMQKLTTDDIANMQKQMNNMLKVGLDMGMKGKTGADAVDYITDMLITAHTNASSKEEKDMYSKQLERLQNDPGIAEMRNWSPKQLIDQTQLALMKQASISPEYIKSEMEQMHGDKRAQIGADASIKAAGTRADSSGSEKMFSLEQRLSTTIQNIADLKAKMGTLPNGSPELNNAMNQLKQLDSLRQNLERTLLGTKSVTQTQQIGNVPFTTTKQAGPSGGPQATQPRKWNPQTKTWE